MNNKKLVYALIAAAVVIGLIVGSALLFPNGNAPKDAEKSEGGSSFGQFVIPPKIGRAHV